MKKSRVILVSLSVVLIISIGLYLFINYNKTKNVVSITPIITTSAEVISKLQSYPYDENSQPKYDFEYMRLSPQKAQYIVDDFCNGVAPLKKNQQFITSPELTYETEDFNYVIRGILQTTNKDGSITEQDVEYEFTEGICDYEAQKFLYELVAERILSTKQ